MRVIQICPYAIDRPGGVQNHVRDLCKELRRRGHQTLTIAPGPPPQSQANDVLCLGAHKMISLVGTRFELSWASRSELCELSQRIAVWRPDIVHCHGVWVPFLAMQVLRRTRVATVASFHDTPPDTASGRLLRLLFQLISRRLLMWLDGAIAVSPAPLAHLRTGEGSAQPIVLPPGIDLEPFFAVAKDKRRLSDEFSVLFIGRLEGRKGIDVLLKAWHLISERDAPVGAKKLSLTIAGAGKLENQVLRAQGGGAGNELRFKRAPTDEEVKQLLRSVDLVVVPSPSGESFGIVIVEALAAGVPVIAADNRGFRSVLTGEGRQSLFTAGDAQALANAIIEAANNEELLKSRAEWGRGHARQFDIRQVAVAIESVYASAVKRFNDRQEGRSVD
ncbi:MAG TPA: glycosyltransferase family 4 protein [Aestuariivirgaceae bacterium]